MNALTTDVEVTLWITDFSHVINQRDIWFNRTYPIAIQAFESVAKCFCDYSMRQTEDSNSIENNIQLKFIKRFSYESPYVNEHENALFKHIVDADNVNLFYSRVMDLVTAANIIYPGIIIIGICQVTMNSEIVLKEDFSSLFSYLRFVSSDLPSALLGTSLTLSNVFSWVCNIEKNEYRSISPIGRAIGAFNRLLLLKRNEHEHIVWLVIAIEALLCPNENFKTKQIHKNSKYIGSSLSRQKIYDIYEIRSSFTHGSEDFDIYPRIPYSTRSSLSNQEPPNINLDLHHIRSAFQLLIETFQHMACRNTHTLTLTDDTCDGEDLQNELNTAISKVTINGIYYENSDTAQELSFLVKDIALNPKNGMAHIIYQEQSFQRLTLMLPLESWLRTMTPKQIR
jgi:hypothetical protein